MSFLSILKALFKETPSLQDFIEAHNPVSTYHVEELERQYSRIYLSGK
jgi:predicted transposase YdaD